MSMIIPVKPWKAGEPCPLPRFEEFKKELNNASFHNAGPSDEAGAARKATHAAAEIALDQLWPLWAIKRMFREIAPLVDETSFLQMYVNILLENQK